MVRRAQQQIPVPGQGFRSSEMDWLRHNEDALSKYRGEWIALDGPQLVAHASDLETLLLLAQEAGRPHPFVVHVPVEPLVNLEVCLL